METLYDHAGGWEALRRFSEIFYRSCLADPILQPLFGPTFKPEHVDHFAAFEAETFGGPETFTEELGGMLLMIDVHRGFKINEEQRQRFVDLYLAAADQAHLPADPAFREALRTHVEFGSAVAVQNSNAETDDQLHPLRHIPKWNWPDEAAKP